MNFKETAVEVATLVEEKSAAYGDSFGKSGAIVKILYPNGIPVDQYDDALALVRIIDKMFRIATKKDAFGEDPWRDILGYALNAAARKQQIPQPLKPPPLYRMKGTHAQWGELWIKSHLGYPEMGFLDAKSEKDAQKLTKEDVENIQRFWEKKGWKFEVVPA